MSLLTYKAITFEIDIIIKCDDKRYFIISSLVIKYKILTNFTDNNVFVNSKTLELRFE